MRSFILQNIHSRTLVITLSVVALHVMTLWALQSGLLRRVVQIVVPVQVLSEVIEVPRQVAPPPARPVQDVRRPVQPSRTPPVAVPQMPQPVAVPQLQAPVLPKPDASPNAPTAIAAPAPLPPVEAPVAQQPAAAVVAPAPAPVMQAKPAPPRVELPSSDAGYLQNPKPVYPPMSKRLNEQGTVLVRVLIGVDGTAQQAEIQQSSSFDRLDQAALATVLKWRYVPGKRGGQPEAMWFTVPIAWVLK